MTPVGNFVRTCLPRALAAADTCIGQKVVQRGYGRDKEENLVRTSNRDKSQGTGFLRLWCFLNLSWIWRYLLFLRKYEQQKYLFSVKNPSYFSFPQKRQCSEKIYWNNIISDLSHVKVRTRFSFPSRPYPRCTTSFPIHNTVCLLLSPFSPNAGCPYKISHWSHKCGTSAPQRVFISRMHVSFFLCMSTSSAMLMAIPPLFVKR